MAGDVQVMNFTWDASAAQSPLFEFNALRGMTIVGLSFCAQSFTGSPTNAIATVVDDGVASAAAVTHATAGTPATWVAKDLGGTNNAVHVEAGSVVGLN